MLISEATVSRLRMINRMALQDTCVRLIHSPQPANAYGVQEAGYVEGEILPCLFRSGSKKETMGQTRTPAAQARLRLAHDVVLLAADRIKLTHLHGEALTPAEVYEVVGPPRLTWVGLEADLRLVS